MPHTTRRKNKKTQQSQNKRREIVDEDGWIRVTSATGGGIAHRGHRTSAVGFNEEGGNNNDSNNAVVAVTKDVSRSRSGSDSSAGSTSQMVFTWGGVDGTVVTRTIQASPWNPMSVSKRVTVDDVRVRYDIVEQRFRKTLFCERLKDVLTRRILPPTSTMTTREGGEIKAKAKARARAKAKRIKNCVLFGSGSLSGDEVHWIDRRESAFYQVSAFLTVVDIIARLQGTRPECLAQEPGYNSVDVEVLKGLGVKVVVHPDGFEALKTTTPAMTTPTTTTTTTTAAQNESDDHDGKNTIMVYSPAAEMEVEYQILSLEPQIWLHRSIDHLLLSTSSSSSKQTFSSREREANSKLIQNFRQEYEFTKLPEVEVKNFPFHDSVIWWKKEKHVRIMTIADEMGI